MLSALLEPGHRRQQIAHSGLAQTLRRCNRNAIADAAASVARQTVAVTFGHNVPDVAAVEQILAGDLAGGTGVQEHFVGQTGAGLCNASAAIQCY